MALRDFVLIVAVCLAWAVNNVLSKVVVTGMHVPPLSYAAVRFGLVALCTFPFLLPAPRPLWRMILVGLCMGAVNFGTLFMGLRLATSSSAAVVLQLGVPMMTLLSVLLLGERIHWRRGLGILLTFSGAMMVIWDPHGVQLSAGLLLVAASASAHALGAVMMKRLEGVKPLTYQAWVGMVSTWPLAALSFMTEPGAAGKAIDAGLPFLGAVVFSAIVVSLMAHSAFFVLLQRYEANLISALTLMTPLATIGLGVAVLHEPFGWRMALGSAVALLGVLIVALRGNKVMALLLAVWNRGS